jgi:hypothetical protein
MAMECRSPVWRRAARTGKRKARESVQWLWPLIGPVGLGIAVACGESWADPQVVSPSGLPVQVRHDLSGAWLAGVHLSPRRDDTTVWRRIRNNRNARNAGIFRDRNARINASICGDVG